MYVGRHRGWVGTAIRQARLARHLTQRELAERMGTSSANISRWETGAAMPGLDRLGPLCRALGVSPDYFVKGDNR